MQLTSQSFEHGQPIPEHCAFARPHPTDHFTLSDNHNPHLAWSDAPKGTKSFVLICVDTDAPTDPTHVNTEGATVPASLARADFFHWLLVDLPPTCRDIAEGASSDGVTVGGKSAPAGPEGSRQGVNDFTAWMAGNPDMKGTYRGYDGPAPPWNDELVHTYYFRLYALDVANLELDDDFTADQVLDAIEGHVLDQAEVMGTYTLNPALRAGA